MWQRGLFSCIGGFMIQLTLGSIFSFGNLTTYLTSYLRIKVDPTVSYSQTVWISSLLIACQGGFMFVGGILHRRYGVRMATLIGCFIASGGVIATYWTIRTSYALTVLSYGVVGGIGVSAGYAPSLLAGPKWFPAKFGFVSGMVVSGYALSGFVFNQVQTAFINPHNIQVEADGYFHSEQVLNRVPCTFLLLGAIFLIMQVCGIILLLDPPAKKQISATITQHATTRKQKNDTIMNISWVAMLKTPQFYLLWMTACAMNVVINFYQGSYKTFGQSFIRDDAFLSMLGSVSAVSNALGRLCWGLLYDHTSYKICMLLMTGVVATMSATVWIAPYSSDDHIFYFMWIVVLYFTFSGLFCVMPSVTALTFGSDHATVNYGVLFTNTVVAGPLAGLFANVVVTNLGWTDQFFVIAAFPMLAFILSCVYPSQYCTKQKQPSSA